MYKHNFTPEQEKEICDLYEGRALSIEQICATFGFTFPVLYRILKNNKIKHRGNQVSSEIEREIVRLGKQDVPRYEIAKRLKISKACVAVYLRKHKIKLSPKGRFKKKYTINENYLKSIDAFTKAQLLGLIQTDGTLSSFNKLISIRLVKTDLQYLEAFKKEIGSNKPIYFVTGRKFIGVTTGKEYQGNDTACLDITNVNFYENCLKCGLVPRKTWKNIPMPNEDILPPKFRAGFALGVFEGDGSLSSYPKTCCFYFNIAGQKKLCFDIFKLIKEELGIVGKVRPHSSIWVVEYKRIKDLIKIYHWLYKDARIWLSRKRNKFREMLEIFREKGYDIGSI